ncbi:MAG TPA: glycosyltransferase family 2 protein [Conexivisphaerales archaeon]|nr:glycosyltransferase family 2 protein [Conexivisphaerales archaeon]
MEKVDVVLLTKDSQGVLRECLDSVYAGIPVGRLIVVDAFSRDGTLDIIAEYNAAHGNVKVIQERGTRGKARETGIREVRTDLFAFVDSDVVLCKGWFQKASESLAPGVGAVWGVDIPGSATGDFTIRSLMWMEAQVFDMRGGCHDILIRSNAVRDIDIPESLHTMEDAFIKEWIESKGYRVVKSFSAQCRHFKTWGSMLSADSIRSSVLEIRSSKARGRWIYNVVFALMWTIYGFRSRADRTWRE